MSPFIEVRTSAGLMCIRASEITWFGSADDDSAVVVAGKWTFTLKGESFQQFKSRLRVATIPAPQKGDDA